MLWCIIRVPTLEKRGLEQIPELPFSLYFLYPDVLTGTPSLAHTCMHAYMHGMAALLQDNNVKRLMHWPLAMTFFLFSQSVGIEVAGKGGGTY